LRVDGEILLSVEADADVVDDTVEDPVAVGSVVVDTKVGASVGCCVGSFVPIRRIGRHIKY